MRARDLFRRYRVALIALALSAAVHAAVFVGMPSRPDGEDDEPSGPTYSATLDALAEAPAATPAPAPRAPAHHAPAHHPRPRPKARPVDVPEPIDALAAADLAPEMDLPVIQAPPPAEPKPDVVAMAQSAVPVAAL
ncbi:MAG TPA: hypothetical protein VH301_09235, partial [Usitatibacter sp.]|nr:hypothetical protein [Usitatibacter sp.]